MFRTDNGRLTAILTAFAQPSIATKTINAMSETAADKPAFRDALRLRRGLIPADSFYEWQSISSKHKQPFSIGMADDSAFAFAGLWESLVGAKGDIVETCTILTTTPNALVAEVHRRMPAILKRRRVRASAESEYQEPLGCYRLLRAF